MAPISNVEKCKRYRVHHQEETCKNDSLRKRYNLEVMKTK